MRPINEFDLYFSYAQFSMFDSSLDAPFLEWSDQHMAQGFVRGDSIVAAGMLLSHGVAHATVYGEPPHDVGEYQRVVAIPLTVTSGHLAFSNPDALPEEAVNVDVPSGYYRVFIAQKLDSDRKHQTVDVFLAKTTAPENTSQILVADAALAPTYPLLEDSAYA